MARAAQKREVTVANLIHDLEAERARLLEQVDTLTEAIKALRGEK